MSRTITFTSLVDNTTVSTDLPERYKVDKTLNAFGGVISVALSRTSTDPATDQEILETYKKALDMFKLGNIKVYFAVDGQVFISDEVQSANFSVTDGGKFFITDKPDERYILETLRMNIV